MMHPEKRRKNKQMLEQTLIPCPFCGKEATVTNLIGTLFIVGCNYNPNCPGYIGKQAPVYYTEELARKYWNRRNGEQDGIHS